MDRKIDIKYYEFNEDKKLIAFGGSFKVPKKGQLTAQELIDEA